MQVLDTSTDFIWPFSPFEQHGWCLIWTCGLSGTDGNRRVEDSILRYSLTPLGNFVRHGDNKEALSSRNCLHKPHQIVNCFQVNA